jgi:hypothetical protein
MQKRGWSKLRKSSLMTADMMTKGYPKEAAFTAKTGI